MNTECNAFRSQNRRDFFRAGGAWLFGMALADFFRARANAAEEKAPKATQMILLWMAGGPPHQDTFYMKPDTPPEFRGIYRPIQTSAPGIHICEKLPNVAPHMDKVTLIRTVRHEMRNHNSAGYYSLTGYNPPSDDQRLRDSRDLFPAYGSVVHKLAPSRAGMPTFVSPER